MTKFLHQQSKLKNHYGANNLTLFNGKTIVIYQKEAQPFVIVLLIIRNKVLQVI